MLMRSPSPKKSDSAAHAVAMGHGSSMVSITDSDSDDGCDHMAWDAVTDLDRIAIGMPNETVSDDGKPDISHEKTTQDTLPSSHVVAFYVPSEVTSSMSPPPPIEGHELEPLRIRWSRIRLCWLRLHVHPYAVPTKITRHPSCPSPPLTKPPLPLPKKRPAANWRSRAWFDQDSSATPALARHSSGGIDSRTSAHKLEQPSAQASSEPHSP